MRMYEPFVSIACRGRLAQVRGAMSQPEDEESSLLEPHEHDTHEAGLCDDGLRKWLSEKSKGAFFRLLQLEKRTDYWAYLAKQTDEKLSDMEYAYDAGAAEVSLLHVPASLGREVGCRLVFPVGLRQKATDLSIAREWRPWDVVELCRLKETGNLFFIKFHHRAAAIHVTAYYYMQSGSNLPPWLLNMCKTIPMKWHGTMDKAPALATAYSRSASLHHGTVELSWLDIICQVKADQSIENPLQEVMYRICPEHAEKVSLWKYMKALTTRIKSYEPHLSYRL